MIYSKFAQFYDDLFDVSLYDRWLTYTTNVAKTHHQLATATKILDLACGTGRLAVKLADANYQVTGADLSTDMLTMADQRATKAGVSIPFIQTDMRDLEGLDQYDIITCFDDSLNYLVTSADLRQTFNSVNQHLNSGGHFLFDVITPYQIKVVYPGFMYNYRDETAAFMWTSYEGDFAPVSVEHDLSFFLYNAQKDAYDAYSELHRERAYDRDELTAALAVNGFKRPIFTTDFGEQPYVERVKRWFVDVVKE
ncbi:methyltransferase [Lentilactobacillus fungorum]|uniref:Methyltransferase n=1 Tax=Lentilactobacillus fungorum TaxID=2201250 RepID=A0ABQ3VZR2_9LACO|nr:class I SAM-dependent methyltransferase [Lentilactobacillus fungorum]GHP12909.1 methyltransferase [Lentilactobacillus fungorum]